MNLLNAIVTGLRLWRSYGSGAQKLVTIVNQIDAIDNGHILSKIDTVLKSNGIDLSGLAASAGVTMDLTTIKGIQAALNALGCTPKLEIDGLLAAPTIRAVTVFQKDNHLTSDGIPGPETAGAIGKLLAQRGLI